MRRNQRLPSLSALGRDIRVRGFSRFSPSIYRIGTTERRPCRKRIRFEELIPALFLELTYHLEHHLYPQVPSHNLAKLSQRLEPTFREAGVVPWIVP